MDDFELQITQDVGLDGWKIKGIKEIQWTPEQRDSEIARRRAKREDNSLTPLRIKFYLPTTERQRQIVNQREVPTSSNIRMHMVDITNHQSHVTHDHEDITICI